MARIPIAEIPNAPQTVPMPSDGRTRQVNLAPVAAMFEGPQIRQGSFDGPSEGLRSIGQGVVGISAAGAALAKEKIKADDDVAILNADNSMREKWAGFQASLHEHQNTDEWTLKGRELLDKHTQELLADKSLSSHARAEIGKRSSQFSSQALAGLTITAAKTSFARSEAAHKALLENYIAEGNEPAAMQTIDLMAEKKLIYPEEVPSLKDGVSRKHELFSLSREIDAYPKAAREKLSGLIDENGRTRNTKLSLEQIEKLKDSAARSYHQRKTQLMDEIGQLADANLLRNKEQIEELGQGYFDPIDVAVLDRKRQKLQPPAWDEYSSVLNRAQSYDPAKDTDGSQHYAILRDINNLPDGWREKIRNDFNDTQRPSSELRSIYSSRVNDLLKMGFFGDISKNDKDQPENPEQYAKAHEAAAKMLFNLTEFGKKAPSAGPEEYARWFKDNSLQHKYVAVDSGSRWYNPFSWGGGAQKQPEHLASYNEIASKGLSGSQPLATGTMYGYRSDPYKDTNSLAGIGAWVPRAEQEKIKAGKPSEYKLKEGDVAISPDMEKQFAAKGIKPFDMVKVTFEDGSSTTVRWADRTMQDKQAKEKLGQPLRGRIDFYSPEGNTPFDGKKIIQFEKAK